MLVRLSSLASPPCNQNRTIISFDRKKNIIEIQFLWSIKSLWVFVKHYEPTGTMSISGIKVTVNITDLGVIWKGSLVQSETTIYVANEGSNPQQVASFIKITFMRQCSAFIYINRKFQKKQSDNTKTPPKNFDYTTIAVRLKDATISWSNDTATQLVWLCTNGFDSVQHIFWILRPWQ